MTILRCYTLSKDSLTPGISVDDFDSILCDTQIGNFEHCRIETFQLLDNEMLTKFSKLPSACVNLSFVHPVTDIGNEVVDNTASVLAVDAKYWRPAHDRQRMFIIDPAGADNKILILAGKKHCSLLVATYAPKTVYLDDKGIPDIKAARKSRILMDALLENTSHYNTMWDITPKQVSVKHIESPKET